MEINDNAVSVLDKNIEKKVISNKKETENLNKKQTNRDLSIDFIRIVACLIVIATHLTLTTYNVYENQVDWSRLFTKCFLADGVPVFFLITGFFISNGRSYKKILKKAFRNVILPAFLVLVFSDIFAKFIVNQETIINCIKNIGINNLKHIIKCILKGELSEIQVAAHLWYIFAYIQIIILFPFFKILCNDKSESIFARRLLMLLCFSNILLTDVQKFIELPIGKISIFNIIDEKILLIFLGYELNFYKEKIKNNRKIGIYSILLFFIINVLRYKAEMQYMILKELIKEEAFLNWYTSFSIISAVCLFIALYCINIKSTIVSKIISEISKLTFGIYLIHFMIIAKIDIYKFEKVSTFKFEILYMIIGTISIFTISLLIIYTIRKIVLDFFRKI